MTALDSMMLSLPQGGKEAHATITDYIHIMLIVDSYCRPKSEYTELEENESRCLRICIENTYNNNIIMFIQQLKHSLIIVPNQTSSFSMLRYCYHHQHNNTILGSIFPYIDIWCT